MVRWWTFRKHIKETAASYRMKAEGLRKLVLDKLWDRTGERYRQGKGLRVFADGKEVAASATLGRITGKLPSPDKPVPRNSLPESDHE